MIQDEPPLVIRSAGTLLDERAVLFPTVLLDASLRPDVAELPRVVSERGAGDLASWADVALSSDGRRVVRLRVAMTTPVEVSWTVVFHLPAFDELLRLAADTGCLVFGFAGQDGELLGVDLDADSLLSVLEFGS